MAEEVFIEDPEDALPSGPSASDATAVSLALAQTQGHSEVAADTSAFLRRQSRMLDLQMEHLHEQRTLQLSHMALRRINERLRIALQVMTIVVGTAIAVAIGVAAWQAHKDQALVIEPFTAPPALAQKGLTGTVLATQLLDKLAKMQSQTDSARAPSTYKNNWGDDIKVEIPETGVSVGELLRTLTKWLGHETHITGEVFGTAKGLAVTARAGSEPGDTFEGPETDLDTLMQRAAEAIYKRTQPYRYSVYLSQNGREQEAIDVLADLATKGPVGERAWAYIGWGGALEALGDTHGQIEKAEKGLALDPNLASGWMIAAQGEEALGRAEASSRDLREAVLRLTQGYTSGLSEASANQTLLLARARLAANTADFLTAAQFRRTAANSPDYLSTSFEASAYRAVDMAYAHDLAELQPVVSQQVQSPFALFIRAYAIIAQARMSGNWASVVGILEETEREATHASVAQPIRPFWKTGVWPWLAYAYARVGRRDDAELLINSTPEDCYVCMRVRGLIAAARGDYRAADLWLARAATAAPSLPFAFAERGQIFLQRGDLGRSIVQFRMAHAKGPAWADPLASWGQALMRQGNYAEAARKFADASRRAPRWALVQQLWGQALDRLGDHAEAVRHYAAAKALAGAPAPAAD